ncbi:MAG: NADH-quinone oxidoreductase subunit C [Candidatus Eisenbacteria bacterium]|nr:NADH-quinone oxidoreductase subunit C [Candidatus Eisenbacteria bacterium]
MKERLDSIFRDIRTEPRPDGRLTVVATPASVPSVLRFLREDGYDYLQLISCVDWIGEGELEVVYVLSFYPGRRQVPDVAGKRDVAGVPDVASVPDVARVPVVLKTRVPRESPSLETSIGIFPVAEPYEREIHELYGVRFDGHPRLTPLFLERSYEIPPFRKDFDTRQYVEELFGSVPPVGEESQGQ